LPDAMRSGRGAVKASRHATDFTNALAMDAREPRAQRVVGAQRRAFTAPLRARTISHVMAAPSCVEIGCEM